MTILKFIHENIYVITILIIGAFLRFDRLGELMPFIGDQGWFYLSARDMVLTGNIPLVGVTSSHTWLHQGPLWTYMLAGTLLISNFNPVSGAVLTALIGTVSIFLIYKLGEEFFSKNFGLVAALIYATSPLIIIHERLAYHTSPIPFVVLVLIYSLLKVIKGRSMYFPISALCLSFLYNFELATVVFIPVVLLVLGIGIYKKEKWIKPLKNRKVLILSMLGLLIPMTPILIYDFQHGFPQTIKFGAWFFYKGLQVIGLIEKSMNEPFLNVVNFFIDKISLLIFAPSALIAVSILLATFGFCGASIKKINFYSPLTLIFSLTTIGLIGFFTAGAKSEAYLPMLFPGVILLTSFLFVSLIKVNKYAIFIVIAVSVLNAIFISQNDYFVDRSPGYGASLKRRIETVEKMLKLADGRSYNLVLKGPGSEFESSTMNYEYLAWWLGRNQPSKEKQALIFVIEEKQAQIDVKIKERPRDL